MRYKLFLRNLKEYLGDITSNIERDHLIIQVGSLQRLETGWLPHIHGRRNYRVGFRQKS